jgi:hypothetical protein
MDDAALEFKIASRVGSIHGQALAAERMPKRLDARVL